MSVGGTVVVTVALLLEADVAASPLPTADSGVKCFISQKITEFCTFTGRLVNSRNHFDGDSVGSLLLCAD
jgi:hypothetical protein